MQGVNPMSIVRVGSTSPYAAGWDHVFGGSRSKTTSRTKKAGARIKKAGKAGKTAATSAAKPKAAKAKASKQKKAARGRK